MKIMKTLGLGIALVGFAGIATAGLPDWDFGRRLHGVPEIDPASAMAGVTMLLGGLAVVRGRRAKSGASKADQNSK